MYSVSLLLLLIIIIMTSIGCRLFVMSKIKILDCCLMTSCKCVTNVNSAGHGQVVTSKPAWCAAVGCRGHGA